jgi:hypothetical protein
MKYELGFYIPEDDILHSHRRGNLKILKKIPVSKAVVGVDVYVVHSCSQLLSCFLQFSAMTS